VGREWGRVGWEGKGRDMKGGMEKGKKGTQGEKIYCGY